ncbi:MAG TPA: LysR family transcriptional regulator, partial [Acidovorax sp.]
MRVFQAVVEEGGFAAAARSMDLSPPVVTRLVADLEQHLGTRLLQRTTRKLALTDAGESYLLRVRAILHEIEDAEAAAAASTRDLRGTIRVLAAPLLATHFLAPMLASWHALYPKLMLDILVDPFPAMRVDEFDVTFMVAGDDYDGNIVARPMAHWEAVVIAAPGYLQRKGVPAEPGDLQNHEYLRYSGQLVRSQSGAARRLRLQPLHGAGAAQEVKVPVVLQSV